MAEGVREREKEIYREGCSGERKNNRAEGKYFQNNLRWKEQVLKDKLMVSKLAKSGRELRIIGRGEE